MVSKQFASAELQAAAERATLAHARLRGLDEQSADYQKALNNYLQSTIVYMSIVSVVQARQHELLTQEVAELRAKVDARPEPMVVH